MITEGAFDSQNLAFFDPQIGQYREYHRTFVNGVRAIMTGTSKDFVTWTDPVLLEYQAGIPDQQLYTNAVQPYWRAPHLLMGFPTRFLPNEGQRVEPTLMTSRDGLHFHRWLDPVIPESAPEDRGGNRSNYMAWGLVEIPGRPGHLSVYATEAYYTGPDSRVRRFEYRKDGFVSVRAGAQGGELHSKLLKFQGSQLNLNFTTGDEGTVRVELQDADGKLIPGYTLVDCEPLSGDQLDQVVSWKSGSDVSQLAGRSVHLRIVLKNADLYAIQFTGNNK
ncbi:MAG: hypothetical protein B7Z55_11400 [Planctomycetales bacterium 12-60-4]|nr:MAG: hypothetical protein B7Z55_11400 [Planctomycetales bacterium 12-60-4]